MHIKVLSPKVSFGKGDGFVQFVILGKIERWKEALLTAWLVAWVFVGAVVFREYYYAEDSEMRMALVIFLIFWVYFFWKVGKTWLFRLGGNELVRIEEDRLLLKRSFFTYGSTRTYYLDIIGDFKPVEISGRSFSFFYESGWWVLGAEKLCFNYQGRHIKFAMQISDKETQEIYQIMSRYLRDAKKTHK